MKQTDHRSLLEVAAEELRDVSPSDADTLEELAGTAVTPRTAFEVVRDVRRRLGVRVPSAETVYALRHTFPL